MEHRKIKYLILGGGLAGTLLSQTMEQYGEDFLVVDTPEKSQASRVAGGMFNPVVFRRLQKSWMADDLIPFLKRYYPAMETLLGQRFFYPRKLIKIMGAEDEAAFWKATAPEQPYILPELKTFFPQQHIAHSCGAGEVLHAGNVDIPAMMDAWHHHLAKNKKLIVDAWDSADMKITGNGVRWKEVVAEYVIFAEGWRVQHNPYFGYIPLKPAKGDVLLIKVPGFETDAIINKKIWMLPAGNQRYKVGSTYRWDNLNEIPCQASAEEILDTLQHYLKLPWEIIDHRSGVRPTVGDRRPLLGRHPEYERLLIFNGLGTKGVMLGPYFADHFIRHLRGELSLMPQVDVARFQRRWFKKKT